MATLLKRDFLVTKGTTDIPVLIVLILAYVMMLPPTFTFFIIVLSLLINIYYYDHRATINRFAVSLPISRKTIIQSRYVYFFIITNFVVLFQLVIGYGLTYFTSGDFYAYVWKDIVTLVCLALIMGAIFIPLFYLFKQFLIAASTMMLIFFFMVFFSLTPLTSVLGMENYVNFNALDPGYALLIEKYIPGLPFIITGIATFFLYFLSMKLSTHIWQHKDL
ncbi:ABC-2 transporter permease [Virgibacillus doumboii]|uniref:ABC-2 transporter permease n=1 Tax=Virgibacillus doumboii TaxID=2697503 RepID=UPI0013DF598A|nr:ABC-2 transporter permease [Virgibacillus doumboii]